MQIDCCVYHLDIRGEDSGYFICAVKDDAWGFAEIVVKSGLLSFFLSNRKPHIVFSIVHLYIFVLKAMPIAHTSRRLF